MITINGKDFDFNKHTYVMGILNVTPDSFSDGGSYKDVTAAVDAALKMIQDGAGIIDIGGESTRPGFEPVAADVEMERVIPVIEGIRKKSDITISIDTTKASVARAALNAGADIINDVSGFMLDENMYDLARQTDAFNILMHDGAYFSPSVGHYMTKFKEEMLFIVQKALNAGISRDKIIIDPGVGFGKTVEENLILIKNIKEICGWGYPVLLGCSRKSVIGKTMDLPVGDRLEGTLTTSVYAAMGGCSIVRVHDVKENYRAVKMYEIIRDVDE